MGVPSRGRLFFLSVLVFFFFPHSVSVGLVSPRRACACDRGSRGRALALPLAHSAAHPHRCTAEFWPVTVSHVPLSPCRPLALIPPPLCVLSPPLPRELAVDSVPIPSQVGPVEPPVHAPPQLQPTAAPGPPIDFRRPCGARHPVVPPPPVEGVAHHHHGHSRRCDLRRHPTTGRHGRHAPHLPPLASPSLTSATAAATPPTRAAARLPQPPAVVGSVALAVCCLCTPLPTTTIVSPAAHSPPLPSPRQSTAAGRRRPRRRGAAPRLLHRCLPTCSRHQGGN